MWPAKYLIYAAKPFGSPFFSLDSHGVLQRFLKRRHGHMDTVLAAPWEQYCVDVTGTS